MEVVLGKQMKKKSTARQSTHTELRDLRYGKIQSPLLLTMARERAREEPTHWQGRKKERAIGQRRSAKRRGTGATDRRTDRQAVALPEEGRAAAAAAVLPPKDWSQQQPTPPLLPKQIPYIVRRRQQQLRVEISGEVQ